MVDAPPAEALLGEDETFAGLADEVVVGDAAGAEAMLPQRLQRMPMPDMEGSNYTIHKCSCQIRLANTFTAPTIRG